MSSGSVEHRLERVEDRLERVEDRLEHVEDRLEHVEDRLEHVEDRLERVQGRLDGMDGRLGGIEQILPTLATKAELNAAIDPLAARLDEVSSVVRRHMDVVAESLREDIRLLAAGVVANQQRLDDERAAREQADATLDRRVTRLEATRRAPRK